MRALFFAALVAAVPAEAQQARNCAPRPIVLENLAKGYGEIRQGIGIDFRGAVVEVYASIETGTWTIIVTSPSGITCIVSSGQSFETLQEMLPPAGDDT